MKISGNSSIIHYLNFSFIKNLSLKDLFLCREIKITFILAMLLSAASCKTCKCPAYTYKSNIDELPAEILYKSVNKFHYLKSSYNQTFIIPTIKEYSDYNL